MLFEPDHPDGASDCVDCDRENLTHCHAIAHVANCRIVLREVVANLILRP
jgi:hypothetical protein